MSALPASRPAVGERLPPERWTALQHEMETFATLFPPQPGDPEGKRNPHVNPAYARDQIYGGLFVDGNHMVALLCRFVSGALPAEARPSPG